MADPKMPRAIKILDAIVRPQPRPMTAPEAIDASFAEEFILCENRRPPSWRSIGGGRGPEAAD
jgi:hypothetical protein